MYRLHMLQHDTKWYNPPSFGTEANASLMAAAYAKLTGRLAVCVATSGPGASNLTTGCLDEGLMGEIRPNQ